VKALQRFAVVEPHSFPEAAPIPGRGEQRGCRRWRVALEHLVHRPARVLTHRRPHLIAFLVHFAPLPVPSMGRRPAHRAIDESEERSRVHLLLDTVRRPLPEARTNPNIGRMDSGSAALDPSHG
jgi:hypothetical protein